MKHDCLCYRKTKNRSYCPTTGKFTDHMSKSSSNCCYDTRKPCNIPKVQQLEYNELHWTNKPSSIS